MQAIIGRIAIILGALLALAASPAQAVSLDNLEGPGFEPIYGDYAPGGDCSLEPRVTIDASGFTFHAAGVTEHRSKVEFALSFFGPEYDGASLAFFPFPLGEYEFGRVLMTANADEQQGLLRFDDNTGPGDTFTPLEAALVKTATMQLCSASATPEPAKMEQASGNTTPWELVQTETGSLIAYVDVANVGGASAASFSIYCSENRPAIAMLLGTPSPADELALSWQFDRAVKIAFARSNREGTFWQAYLEGTGLLEQLMRDDYRDYAVQVSVNGTPAGLASLADAAQTIRPALGTCANF